MSESLIRFGDIEETYTSAGNHSGYMIEMYHEGLKETRHLSARDEDILQGKINNQVNSWNKKWERQLDVQDKKDKNNQAKELTEKSKQELEAIEGLLSHTLSINDAVDWESLKNKGSYSVAHPRKPMLIAVPKKPVKPREPRLDDFIAKKKPIWTVFPGGMAKYEEKQKPKYQQAVAIWKKDIDKAYQQWENEKDKINKENINLLKKHSAEVKQWKAEKSTYETKQANYNKKVDELSIRYQEKDTEAVVQYCEMVLNNSTYPDSFPRDYEIQYNKNNGMLIVDYQLPCLDNIPKQTMVSYIKTRDEFKRKYLSQSAHNKLFESAVYQISLRTIHELLEADVVNAITTVTFNGIVTVLNPATGHNETKCILSIQAGKDEFMKINLSAIDPKVCFKSLKGVGSAKLSSITPVRPILELDKSDRRFKDHYEVAGSIDQGTNLAAMDWEDFEHLVRELFEKEFAQHGGEVKVTQASSDGGVDAVAFDPDPIRGGKIVIQAKRYINTVGVAAVRDLYGTVMNEGATKGILVTTADYGADSYDFANGKPLTLLNGSNLLHLLQKHGHKAKIDIKEARKQMGEN